MEEDLYPLGQHANVQLLINILQGPRDISAQRLYCESCLTLGAPADDSPRLLSVSHDVTAQAVPFNEAPCSSSHGAQPQKLLRTPGEKGRAPTRL